MKFSYSMKNQRRFIFAPVDCMGVLAVTFDQFNRVKRIVINANQFCDSIEFLCS